jgi:ATP-dependent RNA helicase DeaD
MTKQKIEVATVPSVADLRARRLEITRASLREQLTEGQLDDVRVVVQSLAEEFDVVDIAAAAVKLAHQAMTGDGDRGAEADVPSPPRRADGGDRAARRPRDSGPRAPRRVGADVARLFIGAGRRAGIRAADLVGAITNEAGLSSQDLGQIEIADGFSLVDVPEEMADHVIAVMKRASLRGKRVTVRRDRDD